MKECIKCTKEKDINEFPKYGNICKLCKQAYKKAWVKNNTEYNKKRKNYNIEYYKKTKDKRKKIDSEYYLKNKGQIKIRKKAYHKKRLENDLTYKLGIKFRKIINKSLKKKWL